MLLKCIKVKNAVMWVTCMEGLEGGRQKGSRARRESVHLVMWEAGEEGERERERETPPFCQLYHLWTITELHTQIQFAPIKRRLASSPEGNQMRGMFVVVNAISRMTPSSCGDYHAAVCTVAPGEGRGDYSDCDALIDKFWIRCVLVFSCIKGCFCSIWWGFIRLLLSHVQICSNI